MDAGGGDNALDRGWLKLRPLPHSGECGSLNGDEWESYGCARLEDTAEGRFREKNSSWSAVAAGVAGGVVCVCS